MNQDLRELMERNKMVLYEYEDDERSNVNEKYITFDPLFNKYLVIIDEEYASCSSLTEAREVRAKILEAKGVKLIGRG